MKLIVYTADGRMHIFKDDEAKGMLESIHVFSDLKMPFSGVWKNDQGTKVCFYIKNIANYEVTEG
ncbi:hypothetical protein QJS77_05430 [Enterococcus faecium]|uniref:hypothetical protein n=1 Tax=Enterococcus faecium TaxID=1352 RepID=UPI00190E89C1|nr:hypothetical protein [Enterococcus faecium]MBU9741711.1 hypothetical protein [Enterococcus faecium]MDQ8229656.1 hypothetical protein [Enterococcus faecium]MDQ8251885.1 hypothetical protein [Enterococcus faecium]MDQ8304022.1 hypothetical protein [Enterococcus faecium]MDQ8428072.1 hypothetical protein [Enterococcus faecium]